MQPRRVAKGMGAATMARAGRQDPMNFNFLTKIELESLNAAGGR